MIVSNGWRWEFSEFFSLEASLGHELGLSQTINSLGLRPAFISKSTMSNPLSSFIQETTKELVRLREDLRSICSDLEDSEFATNCSGVVKI